MEWRPETEFRVITECDIPKLEDADIKKDIVFENLKVDDKPRRFKFDGEKFVECST